MSALFAACPDDNPTHAAMFCLPLASIAEQAGVEVLALSGQQRQQEAHARIFEPTPAEQFCAATLNDLNPVLNGWGLDKAKVDQCFDAALAQRPGTLRQCVLELQYWNQLYWLRDAARGTAAGDYSAAASARQNYVFRCLSRIRPRDIEEAAVVLRYLVNDNGLDRPQSGAILLNLIGAPEPYRPHEVGGGHA